MKLTRLVLLAALCLSHASNSYAGDQEITDAGDALTILLPLSAYAGTAIAKDKEGAVMFTKSFASTMIMTSVGKRVADKFRPQGESTMSFPSGHASSAFSGAGFLYTRYGKAYGIPAYLLAGFTAYSRVNANAHHIDDVLAGASVGMFNNWFFVSPHESRVVAYPSIYNDNYYMNLSINTGKSKKPT